MLEIFKRLLEVQDLELPRIVFVTGPDALKHGYGYALGWKTDVGVGNIFGKGTHQCRLELGSRTAIKQIKSEDYVINLNHEEIVLWNSTLNVTRRQKNELLHGVQHWTNMNTTTRTKKVEGSCMDTGLV